MKDLPREVLETSHVPLEAEVPVPDEGIDFPAYISNVERQLIRYSLEKTGGTKNKAA